MKYTPGNLPTGFKEFWKYYPKKVGKGQAIKAWVVNECEANSEEIIKALKKYPFSDDKKFIPHPSTFLNQWRWEDTFEEENNDDWI